MWNTIIDFPYPIDRVAGVERSVKSSSGRSRPGSET